MKVSLRKVCIWATAMIAGAMIAGCPLPYQYNGSADSKLNASDPSTPSMTAAVTVSYSEQGGASGTIADGGSFASGKTTTITLATATNKSVIFYTTDGSAVTNYSTAQKMNGSTGVLTVTRSTSIQTQDIHAVAIGPNMLPSQPMHAKVCVSPYPIISIATDKTAVSENQQTATITVTSSSPAPATGLTVSLAASGGYDASHVTAPAASGATLTATIPAGATTAPPLAIIGVHNSDHVSQTVMLAINADPGTPTTYTVGAPVSVSVTVQDDASNAVTYNGNLNTGGLAPTDSTLYPADAPVRAAGNTGGLVRTGYTFAGWNTAANASGISYLPGVTFPMPSSPLTLYAVWNIIQYTLTINTSGNGTTIPAGPRTVSYGAATPITATPNAGESFFSWTLTAGSGAIFASTGTSQSASASDTITLTGGNVTIQANFFIHDYYVNSSSGSDNNPGTTGGTAFKTISKALTTATVSGQIVNVAPGTYDLSNGETFPLYIPAGVTLTGNTAGKGYGVNIQGGGIPSGFPTMSETVVMAKQSACEGFTITNDSGIAPLPIGVLFTSAYSSDGARLAFNTITGNPNLGVYVNGGSTGGSIDNNIFTNNGTDLGFVGGGGNGMSVSYNSFSDRVELDTLGPDLGGGAAWSLGHNSFLASSSTAFLCSGTVYAMNNHWNHNPPTVGPYGNGIDVGTSGSATVLTGGNY